MALDLVIGHWSLVIGHWSLVPCPILLYERLRQRQRSVQVPHAQCPSS
ncbi:hypothetical protein [Nostoc sp.]